MVIQSVSGGIASLNHRLLSGSPSGCKNFSNSTQRKHQGKKPSSPSAAFFEKISKSSVPWECTFPKPMPHYSRESGIVRIVRKRKSSRAASYPSYRSRPFTDSVFPSAYFEYSVVINCFPSIRFPAHPVLARFLRMGTSSSGSIPFIRGSTLPNPATFRPITGHPKTGKLPNEPKSPSTHYHAKSLPSNTIALEMVAVYPTMSLRTEPKLLSKPTAESPRPFDLIRPNQTTFSAAPHSMKMFL